MEIKKGSADVTIYFKLIDPSTGVPETGLTIADLDMTYVRNQSAPAAKVDATALGAADTAHTDNYMYEVDGTNMPGLYRSDWPDAAFIAGVDKITLCINGAAIDPAFMEIDLVDNVAKDSYDIVNNGTYGNAFLTRSTTPANALDISATGEAGLDFANIKDATGAHTLTNITVPVCSVNSDMRGTDSAALASGVDVTSIDGTAQRATDLAEIAQYLFANAATLTSILADDSVIAKLLATGGTVSGYNEATDALQSIRDAITASNPQNHSATANNETTGTLDSGTFADTATVNNTYYQTSPAGAAVGGFGLNVDLTFNIGIGRVPSQVAVTGYFDSGAQRTVQAWGYDYNIADWVQISNSQNDFGNAGSNKTFQYSMTQNMVQASDGEVKIRFTSTSITTGDDWFCDYVDVTSIEQAGGGLTADSIQAAVWARQDSGHDENTLGYNLSKIHVLHGDVLSATSASQFIIDAGVAVNDAYNGMIIVLEDKTDDHYEVRRIVDYIGATNEIFVDRDFGFTPVASDDYYIMSGGYGDVNTTHVSGTAQTANDNGADINTLLSRIVGTLLAGNHPVGDVAGTAATPANVLTQATAALVALKLDHLIAVADADDAVDDSIIAKLAAISGDWSDFVKGDDSLQAISDAVATIDTSAVAAAVWDALLASHTDAGSAGEALSTAGSGSSAADIADAVWDEALADHDTDGTMGYVMGLLDTGETIVVDTEIGSEGYTLEQAKAHLGAWMAADLATATGQSYSIAGRSLTRADAEEIRNNIEKWQKEVTRLSQGTGKRGPRIRGATIVS